MWGCAGVGDPRCNPILSAVRQTDSVLIGVWLPARLRGEGTLRGWHAARHPREQQPAALLGTTQLSFLLPLQAPNHVHPQPLTRLRFPGPGLLPGARQEPEVAPPAAPAGGSTEITHSRSHSPKFPTHPSAGITWGIPRKPAAWPRDSSSRRGPFLTMHKPRGRISCDATAERCPLGTQHGLCAGRLSNARLPDRPGDAAP